MSDLHQKLVETVKKHGKLTDLKSIYQLKDYTIIIDELSNEVISIDLNGKLLYISPKLVKDVKADHLQELTNIEILRKILSEVGVNVESA